MTADAITLPPDLNENAVEAAAEAETGVEAAAEAGVEASVEAAAEAGVEADAEASAEASVEAAASGTTDFRHPPGTPEIMKSLLGSALELPKQPGVYLMKDEKGVVIYVGKAKVLPNRVSSYFRSKNVSSRVALMVAKIQTFDFLVTTTEKEALILENSLIKKYRPRFNVVLRDDKTYPSLRLSLTDDFPRLEIVRRPVRDGSVIFGPFPSAVSLKNTLKIVDRLFPLRKCRRPDVKKIPRPCLNHQIGRCFGPCRPEATKEEYKELTDQVRLFFQGGQKRLVQTLEDLMKTAADRYDFEKAAILRDRLADIRKTLENQFVSLSEGVDLDVWGLASKDGYSQAAVIPFRKGAMTGCRPLTVDGLAEVDPETLSSLVSQFYREGDFVPQEVCLPLKLEPDKSALLVDFLSSLRGGPVKVAVPQKGPRLKLLQIAAENAQATMEERAEKLARTRGALAEIMARLRLTKVPKRLECFDLAHVQGEANVAGMVVMEEGEWKKSQYRKFKIKEAKGGDDFAGMREAVRRRFRPDRPGPAWPAPDLLLIDGGLGQLSAVVKAFEDLDLDPPPMAGIAKDRLSGGADRIFLPGRKNPADLKPGSAGLLLLSKLRDEAHRFCRSYHHDLRSKDMLTSSLSEIKGLGPVKTKALGEKFPAMALLAEASDEEILKVASLSKDLLKAVRERANSIVAQSRRSLRRINEDSFDAPDASFPDSTEDSAEPAQADAAAWLNEENRRADFPPQLDDGHEFSCPNQANRHMGSDNSRDPAFDDPVFLDDLALLDEPADPAFDDQALLDDQADPAFDDLAPLDD
ncbi:MAG: excinuclease ABC subunit UvrC [Deltaproteobacteria bacterium]|jgi:excinuclease ABC subunit C|nr:excinuclease ABC subunit UvrC [Deltaproteobacteria bacterium]